MPIDGEMLNHPGGLSEFRFTDGGDLDIETLRSMFHNLRNDIDKRLELFESMGSMADPNLMRASLAVDTLSALKMFVDLNLPLAPSWIAAGLQLDKEAAENPDN